MAEQHVRYDDGVVGQVDGMQGAALRGPDDLRAAAPAARTSTTTTSRWSGVPFDSGVTYRPGARFGPAAIRQASRLLRPYNPALDAQPFRDAQVVDAGDIAANPFDIDQAIDETREGLPALHDRRRPRRCSASAATTPSPSRRCRRCTACTGRWRWCTSTRTSTRGTPTSTRRARTARRSGARPSRACIVKGSSAHVGIRGSLYDRQDLLDDAELGFTVVHCRDIDRIGVDGVVERVLRTGRRPPGLRLDRHRRAGPGVRPRHGHARGRRHDQPRAAGRAARDARRCSSSAPTSSRCHRPTTTPRSPPSPRPTSAYELLTIMAGQVEAVTAAAGPVSWPGGKARRRVPSPSTSTPSRPCCGAARGSADRMSVMSHQAYGPLVGRPAAAGHAGAAPDPVHVLRARLHRAPLSRRWCRDIVAAGHEIAHHGYLHEQPTAVTPRGGGRQPRPRPAGAGGGRRRAPGRLPGADVGPVLAQPRAARRARLPLRLEPDGRRHPVRARGDGAGHAGTRWSRSRSSGRSTTGSSTASCPTSPAAG